MICKQIVGVIIFKRARAHLFVHSKKASSIAI